ncbi:hypothetical protein [Draconibacterium orientale]|uniref:hypothetical protein n=1 Tax=Draconibacterium orientale TaxID=1168034 RepID=UPI0029C0C76B|nr:hypothetical protein [Draconibacterium orientale]
MIELSVDGEQLALPEDARISIERNSPVLNDDVGTFSTPFPVPTEENEAFLGFPGRLQRANDLPTKEFKLGEDGFHILSGEIAIDGATDKEIGLILKSGTTAFSKKMENKMLSDVDFGSEPFQTIGSSIEGSFLNPLYATFTTWAGSNLWNNGKYRCAPFYAYNSDGQTKEVVNPVGGSGTLHILENRRYCLQFQIPFVIEKIFEHAGYRISENILSLSVYSNAILYGKIIKMMWGSDIVEEPPVEYFYYNSPDFSGTLNYSDLMPEISVNDFIDKVKTLFNITFEVNERFKTVSIYKNDSIFDPANKESLQNYAEVEGRDHGEREETNGFILFYTDQDDESATDYKYTVSGNVATYANLPSPGVSYEDLIFKITATQREYICKKTDTTVWEWQRIGRLKPVTSGDADEEFEIDFKVPENLYHTVTIDESTTVDIEIPFLNITLVDDALIDVDKYISLWRGQRIYSTINFPYVNAERYSIDESIDGIYSLLPDYLYAELYNKFILWKSSRAKPLTKFIEMPIVDAMALRFGKRYRVDEVYLLFDKIALELPYPGYIRIEAYTT